MTRRRWIADEVAGTHAALTGTNADHLSRVLRPRVGQEFDISIGEGLRRGVISGIHPGRVEFELKETVPAARTVRIVLALSIFKFDRMEWAIEKCTELGVERIIPILASRTDSHLAAASVKRAERWRRIAREAAQQSRQTAPPEIAQPAKLKETISQISSGVRIVLSESEREMMLRDVSFPGDQTALAIGPEGGWTAGELNMFQDVGWTSASLGTTILRAETAAIAATAIVLAGLK